MAAVSRQLDILKALTAHLEGITPENGYDVDLTGRVRRGKVIFGDEESLPFVSVLEAPRPDDSVQTAGYARADMSFDWPLLIQGWAQDDDENPTDAAHNLKAAVEHRLANVIAVKPDTDEPMYPEEYMLGVAAGETKPRIRGLTIGPGVVRPPDGQVSATAFFYLPVSLQVVMSITNPFLPE